MATTLPNCPHCAATATLECEWVEMGTQYCVCSCCAKRCRVVGEHDPAVPATPRDKIDISGNEMFEP